MVNLDGHVISKTALIDAACAVQRVARTRKHPPHCVSSPSAQFPPPDSPLADLTSPAPFCSSLDVRESLISSARVSSLPLGPAIFTRLLPAPNFPPPLLVSTRRAPPRDCPLARPPLPLFSIVASRWLSTRRPRVTCPRAKITRRFLRLTPSRLRSPFCPPQSTQGTGLGSSVPCTHSSESTCPRIAVLTSVMTV